METVKLNKIQMDHIRSLDRTCLKIYYLADLKIKNSEIRRILNLSCVQHVYNELSRRKIKLESEKLKSENKK